MKGFNMIEIKMDLVPFGIMKPRRLGYIKIWNDATGTKEIGNYKYRIEDGDTKIEGTIKDFKRLEQNAFHLLKIALNKSIPE
jgi:hypothetical protein